MRRVWGWGKRDGSPQGSGRRRQRPPCGALPDGTERGCKQSQEGDAPGSRQGTEAPRLPHESSTVACATPAPGHSPVRAEGKPSPRAGAPGGCAPRRPCRAATAFPGPPRPPASRRFRRAPGRRPVPRPGCRPARPGPRTAASNQVRPLGVGPPSLMRLSLRRVRAGEDRQRPIHVPRLPEPPRLVEALGHARCLRRLFRLRLLLLEQRRNELVDQLFEAAPRLFEHPSSSDCQLPMLPLSSRPPSVLCCLWIAPACGQRRRAVPGWRRPLRVGMGYEGAGGPVVSGDGPSLP